MAVEILTPKPGPARARWRAPVAYGIAAGWTLGGCFAIWLGTSGLGHSAPLALRWVLALAGTGATFHGMQRAGRERFGRNFQLGVWLAGGWIVVVALAAVLAPVLGFQKPDYLPLATTPYLSPDLFSGHPLGTDGFGRDYLSRLVWGARVSLTVGVGCTLVGLVVGCLLGIAAGYFRGAVDTAIALVTNALLALPPLVLLLAIVAALKPTLGTLFVAFAVLCIPTITRMARASTYVVSRREFVVAARASGARPGRIIVRDIMPIVLRGLSGYAMVIVAGLIVGEASLSFLGLGIQEPAPSWGNMIADSQSVIATEPHALLVPSLILFTTVIAFSRLGETQRAEAQQRRSVFE